MKARKWVVVKHFEGTPQKSDLCIEEEELPPVKDGEFLAEAVFLSVDPYMRLEQWCSWRMCDIFSTHRFVSVEGSITDDKSVIIAHYSLTDNVFSAIQYLHQLVSFGKI